MTDSAFEMSETRQTVRADASIIDAVRRASTPPQDETFALLLSRVWDFCYRAWTLEGLCNVRDWMIRSLWHILGGLVTSLGTVVAMLALKPAFAGLKSSERALNLAEWTAAKDFLEYCSAIDTKGEIPQTCANALNETLPPPPHLGQNKDNIARLSAGLPENAKRGIEMRMEIMPQDYELLAGLMLALVAATFVYYYTTYLYLEEYSRRPLSTLDEESQTSAGWALTSRQYLLQSTFLKGYVPDYNKDEITYRGSRTFGIARFTAPVPAADTASPFVQASAVDYPQLGEYSRGAKRREVEKLHEPLMPGLRFSTSSGSLLETLRDLPGPVIQFAERELVHMLSESFGVYRRPWRVEMDEVVQSY